MGNGSWRQSHWKVILSIIRKETDRKVENELKVRESDDKYMITSRYGNQCEMKFIKTTSPATETHQRVPE